MIGPRRAGPALAARSDRTPPRNRRRRNRARSGAATEIYPRALRRGLQPLRPAHRPSPCAQASGLGARSRRPNQLRAGGDAEGLAARNSDIGRSAPCSSIRSKMRSTILHGVLPHEFRRRTSPARALGRRGHPQRLAQSGAADRARRQDRRRQHGRRILFRDFDPVSAAPVAEGTGAVRQPVAGADRSGALQRLAGQRIQGRSRHAAHRRRPPGRSARRAAHRAARPYRRDAAGAHHRRQDGPAADPSQRRAFGDRAGGDAGA